MGFTVEELKKKKVGVLMGGLSTEREVSLRTYLLERSTDPASGTVVLGGGCAVIGAVTVA